MMPVHLLLVLLFLLLPRAGSAPQAQDPSSAPSPKLAAWRAANSQRLRPQHGEAEKATRCSEDDRGRARAHRQAEEMQQVMSGWHCNSLAAEADQREPPCTSDSGHGPQGHMRASETASSLLFQTSRLLPGRHEGGNEGGRSACGKASFHSCKGFHSSSPWKEIPEQLDQCILYDVCFARGAKQVHLQYWLSSRWALLTI